MSGNTSEYLAREKRQRLQTSLRKHEVVHGFHVLFVRLYIVLRSVRIDRLFCALERFLNKSHYMCSGRHERTIHSTDVEDDQLRCKVARCHAWHIRLLASVNINVLPDCFCSVQVFVCLRFQEDP